MGTPGPDHTNVALHSLDVCTVRPCRSRSSVARGSCSELLRGDRTAAGVPPDDRWWRDRRGRATRGRAARRKCDSAGRRSRVRRVSDRSVRALEGTPGLVPAVPSVLLSDRHLVRLLSRLSRSESGHKRPASVTTRRSHVTGVSSDERINNRSIRRAVSHTGGCSSAPARLRSGRVLAVRHRSDCSSC